MRQINRRTATKVVGGKVQRKSRSAPTPNCYNTNQPFSLIERRKSGPGYRHVLRKSEIERFIGLLPDWPELSKGLNAIVLAPGHHRCAGWHNYGVVAICAWERDLWQEADRDFCQEHRALFEMIGVVLEPSDADGVLIKWTESTVRAYQLVHILLHELGHHHDRMTTRSKRCASRGEGFAESYATRYGDNIWERYLNQFGLP